MVDVTRMPAGAFGSVPTPALVGPIEFTLPRTEYAVLGGFVDRVRPLAEVLDSTRPRAIVLPDGTPFPVR